MPRVEELGIVTTRSGVLMVIDTGYLNLWSHDRPPFMPPGVLATDEAAERANSFVDLRIVGSDSERAGTLLGMSWHPSYVYDQPPDHAELEGKLEKLTQKHKLDAHLEVIHPRVPHRERVAAALEYGRGAGEVQYHGIWAAAVSGAPKLTQLRVLGVRADEPNADRWERVLVECRAAARIANSAKIGVVGVDYARLLIADVDVLGEWQHEESRDGLADFVFWGRDAEQVAFAVAAPLLGEGQFGWSNLPQDITRAHGFAVQEYRDKHSLKLAVDYRPHSDHWRAMTPTRVSNTESATVELAGMSVCNFMTTWGDGLFEVHRDLSESGELVQIRIELEQAHLDRQNS